MPLAPSDVPRFGKFLRDRGRAIDWPPSRLWLALRLAERLHCSPDQPRDGDGRFGSGGGVKLAPDTGDGGGAGGAKNGNGLKRISKAEAARDFRKVPGASQQDFHVHVGDGVRKHLAGLELPVKPPLPAASTSSVYLKGELFDVRINDGHDAKPKKQTTPSKKPEYQLVIPPGSTSVSAKKINKLLSDIVANHKKPKE